MKLLPKKGLKVFNPATKLHLPEDKPTNIQITSYWRRRLLTGEVSEIKEEIKKKSKPLKNNKKITLEVSDDNII